VVERWLQDDVGPTLDRYRADPTRGASLDDAFERLTARMNADADKAR
jgi:antitoxin ParD1/3/4